MQNARRRGKFRESTLLWYNIHAYLLSPLITLLIWLMIIAAVLSWLVAFNVVNPRNQFVGTVMRFADAITRPLLRPLQRFIPPLGGIDITPIILILLLQFFDAYVLGRLVIPALASITPF
jgi:YggT family protein